VHILFNLVAMGGTFEVIHNGHKVLFDVAFNLGKRVIVGITSDDFVKKLYKNHIIRNFERRVKDVEKFLMDKGVIKRAVFVKLNDPYGPTVTDPAIEALVVSEETLKVGLRINKIRQAKNFSQLVIIVVEMVLAEDDLPISTTRILQKVIMPNGKVI